MHQPVVTEPSHTACAMIFFCRSLTYGARYIDYGYAVETAANIAADRVILTGEAAPLAGLEDDLARLNPSIRELFVYTSDASRTLQVELAQNPAAAETLSKSLAGTVNLGVAEPSIAEAIIEEIGLDL